LQNASFGQETVPSKEHFIEEVDSIVNLVQSKWKAPGIAIGLVKDGKVFFKKGYGYKNLETEEPVTSNTLFPIASSTKSFTTTGIGVLVDQGNLKWNKPISDYLPYFQLSDTLANNHSTLIDILCHRTGLPGHEIMQIAIAKQYNRREIVQRIKHLQFSEPFRTKWQYQNQMYQVATVLTEEISGEKWEDFIREQLFAPLEMNSTTFAGSELIQNNDMLATRYAFTADGEIIPAEPIHSFMREVSGGGSIYSNIDDLCNWLIFNLNRGEFDGKRIVSEGTMNEIQHPHIIISPVLLPEILMHSYAPGWDVMAYRSHLMLNRPGGFIGITSQIAYLPLDNLGIVILGNLQSTTAQMILSFEIIDRMLALESTPWLEKLWPYEEYSKQQFINSLKPSVKEGEVIEPSRSLEEYAGAYYNDGYGNILIQKEGDKLFVDYINNSELFHFDQETFETFQLHKFFQFKFINDSEGKIIELQCQFEPSVSPIIFKKVLKY
jgi:CubicO group peptidase (beta-lactamase class C family)